MPDKPKMIAPNATREDSTHEKHCFVVMPFGRDPSEKRWFKGWYEAVIKPAVEAAGYESILSAAEDQPGAINDEIRSHLVFDPMVLVDLGGKTAENPPNPNVMYELGLRHAFGKPTIVMAWEGQTIPFDVSNQRAIISQRDFLDIESTKFKIEAFIKAAEEGKFYNPMKAVGREATIEAASQNLDEGSILGALTEEIRELRNTVASRGAPYRSRKAAKLKSLLPKVVRSELWVHAQTLGYDPATWSKFLNTPIEEIDDPDMHSWSDDSWRNYLEESRTKIFAQVPRPRTVDESLLTQVYMMLPEQPWPTGIHKDVAEKLGVPPAQINKAISELISRGIVSDQKNGVVVVSADADS